MLTNMCTDNNQNDKLFYISLIVPYCIHVLENTNKLNRMNSTIIVQENLLYPQTCMIGLASRMIKGPCIDTYKVFLAQR